MTDLATSEDRARAAAFALASREPHGFEDGAVPRCAPLRQGPWPERLLRYLLVLAVVGVPVYQIVDSMRSTRFVEAGGEVHATLRNHIAEGRVTTIDLTDARHVQWRLRDGTVYAEYRYPSSVDLQATIAVQPYARANPGSIRFAEIDKPVEPPGRDERDPFEVLLALVIVLMMFTGPEPRHLTRWAWTWVSVTGVGFLAYLLLSGSRRRTVESAAPRVGGWATVVLVPTVALVLAIAGWHRETNRLVNGDTRPDTAPIVIGRA